MAKVAVIGAGPAGLACANHLRSAGVEITLFEKSRGIGGRCATRRREGFAFDHGAPYFSVTTPEIRALVDRLHQDGAAREWRWSDDAAANWLGVPGMSATFTPLARDLDIQFSARVTDLERVNDAWRLKIENHEDARGFDAVIVAVPAPQALDLVSQFSLTDPITDTRYAPCLTAMIAYPAPTGIVANQLEWSGGALEKAIRNSAKPNRPTHAEHWVVHASRDWSRHNLERDFDAIAFDMRALFESASGARPLQPTYLAAHRWRYARVENAARSPCFFDEALKLGLAGDWRIADGVESALLSGLKLAETVLDRQ